MKRVDVILVVRGSARVSVRCCTCLVLPLKQVRTTLPFGYSPNVDGHRAFKCVDE